MERGHADFRRISRRLIAGFGFNRKCVRDAEHERGLRLFRAHRFFEPCLRWQVGIRSIFDVYGCVQSGIWAGLRLPVDPNDAPSLVLNLKVNTVSGGVSIVNDTATAISLQGYELTSATGSLDVTPNGWRSLSDQNIDPVMGGDGPGETWEEGGNPSPSGILEGFLLGSSILTPGASLNLGRAFDEQINIQDLSFRYRLASQNGIIHGSVVYDDTPPPPLNGDYNNNGDVDAADYVLWRRNLDSTTTLPNDPTPGMISVEDYGVWRANFGKIDGAGAAATSFAAAVPEPSLSAQSIVASFFAVSWARLRSMRTLAHLPPWRAC